MAATLPLELLFEIATLLQIDEASLVPCTYVCRYWQAALEPLIYANLAVYSDSYHTEKWKRGVSLTHFQKLTSGSRSIRRNWIRNLEYDIIIPCKILDWTTGEYSSQYSPGNQLRQANDFAFQTAMFDLFQILHSWNQRVRLSLHLGLRESRLRRWPATEPDPWHSPTAGEYRFDYRAGPNMSIPPYRACFANNMPELFLEHVLCVDKLSFLNKAPDKTQNHQIWTGAVQTIIQHCPTITELDLDLNEWVRPDYLQYIQGRRASLSSLLAIIPNSLRVLHYNGSEDGPWKHSMPALNVIPSGIDSMTINLRDISIHLRELKLNRTTLPFDFMCPLDEKGQPIIGSLHWPYLKILELTNVPPWLPSGEWASNHTAEYRAEIESDTRNDRMDDSERTWTGRSVMDEEQFHRLFISLGYATQRMPCLKRMEFHMECYCRFHLYLHNNAKASTLTWNSRVAYQPDSRVAKAWRLDIHDLGIESSPLAICSVILPRWPPDEPI